jgi:hypothetical protein
MEDRIESLGRHERRISAVLVVHCRQFQYGHPELADAWLIAARRNSAEIAGIRSKQTAGASMRWHRRWPSPPVTATFTPDPGLTNCAATYFVLSVHGEQSSAPMDGHTLIALCRRTPALNEGANDVYRGCVGSYPRS